MVMAHRIAVSLVVAVLLACASVTVASAKTDNKVKRIDFSKTFKKGFAGDNLDFSAKSMDMSVSGDTAKVSFEDVIAKDPDTGGIFECKTLVITIPASDVPKMQAEAGLLEFDELTLVATKARVHGAADFPDTTFDRVVFETLQRKSGSESSEKTTGLPSSDVSFEVSLENGKLDPQQYLEYISVSSEKEFTRLCTMDKVVINGYYKAAFRELEIKVIEFDAPASDLKMKTVCKYAPDADDLSLAQEVTVNGELVLEPKDLTWNVDSDDWGKFAVKFNRAAAKTGLTIKSPGSSKNDGGFIPGEAVVTLAGLEIKKPTTKNPDIHETFIAPELIGEYEFKAKKLSLKLGGENVTLTSAFDQSKDTFGKLSAVYEGDFSSGETKATGDNLFVVPYTVGFRFSDFSRNMPFMCALLGLNPPDCEKIGKIEEGSGHLEFDPETQTMKAVIDKFDGPTGSLALNSEFKLLKQVEAGEDSSAALQTDDVPKLEKVSVRLAMKLTPDGIPIGQPAILGQYRFNAFEVSADVKYDGTGSKSFNIDGLKGFAEIMLDDFSASFAGDAKKKLMNGGLAQLPFIDPNKLEVQKLKIHGVIDGKTLKFSETELLTPYFKAVLDAALLLSNKSLDDSVIETGRVTVTDMSDAFVEFVNRLEKDLGKKLPRKDDAIVLEAAGTLDEPVIKGLE
jgi:hypothetical protein